FSLSSPTTPTPHPYTPSLHDALPISSAAPGTGIVGSTIQYHGTADRYSLSGATAVGTLYSNATTATSNPAVTLRSVGSSGGQARSEEHTSELQSLRHLVCRLLLEKKK